MSDKEIAISIEETRSNDNNSNVVSTSELQFSAEESSGIEGIDELVTAEELVTFEEEAKAPVQTDKPKIQKVPTVLRGHTNFEKFYEPRAVPIGPIHHKDEKLQLAQQYKPRLAAKFVKESGKTTTELYKKIKAEMEALKLLFDPEVIKDYKEEELSWMSFLDGCSTLQFIHAVVNNETEKYKIKNDRVAFAQQDLFLLENQIPFKVLTLLIDSSDAKAKLQTSIKKFLQMNVMAPSQMWKSIDINIYKDDPTHLLELLQKFTIHQSTKQDDLSKEKSSLLSRLRKKQNTREIYFRNTKELRKAGIKLKPSKTCSLKDIHFTSTCFTGWLKLPPLVVDDSTGPKLLNMIAYEMCPDNCRTNYEVSSYVSLLNSLIDHSSDVKELSSAKILHNLLGSDEEVALLFNEIATDLVPCPSFYYEVISKIQKHCDSSVIRMAQSYNSFFKDMALITGLIGVGLTALQTWYAINPPPDNRRN